MADFKLSLFLLAFMVFATPATAFWRLLCKGQLAVARMDPLINFGQISPHAHAVHGASSKSSTFLDLPSPQRPSLMLTTA